MTELLRKTIIKGFLALAAVSWHTAAFSRLPAPPDGAQRLRNFVQSSPAMGERPTRETELIVWHDARMLYIHVRAQDDQPSLIVGRQLRRDVESMLAEDQVTVVIDAEGRGRNAYLFAVNSNGAQFDALVFDGGRMRYDWDAQWTSEARVEPDGWSATMAIPLSIFGQSTGPSWRLNAERWMPRGSERARLADPQPDRYVYTLGDAVAIDAPKTGRDDWGLRIKPSLRLTRDSAAVSGRGRSEQRLQPGLELFHESDGGLRTTAALNVDFGEAEVDERTVNLSRFELFRLEKREFFLRDAGRFTFGGLVETSLIPYYSRRIGLGTDGRARALDAGLKFTGRLSEVEFGAFAARVAGGVTAPGEPDAPAADVAVLRVAKLLDSRQRVGMLATRGNPSGTSGSHLWGLDYQFRDPAWAGDKTLEANGWLMRTSNSEGTAGAEARGDAWGGSVRYLNVGPMATVELMRIGRDFNPALGYLAEGNVVRGKGTVGWWHRTKEGASVIPAIDWSYRHTLDGRERSLLMNPEIEYTTSAGDDMLIEYFLEEDKLASGYAPVPGTWLAPGTYRWGYFYGFWESAQSRPWWLSTEFRAGGYYNGQRNDQSVMLAWKPMPEWEAQVSVGRNAISLPGGAFTVKLATFRLDHTPHTRLSESLLLQWDNVSAALGISARVRWLWAPGREVIFSLDRIGYTGERRTLEQQQTRALLKFVWSFER